MDENAERGCEDGRHYFVKIDGAWVCAICGDKA